MKTAMRYYTESLQRIGFRFELMLCTLLPVLVAVVLVSFKSPKENPVGSLIQAKEGIVPESKGARNDELAVLIPGLL